MTTLPEFPASFDVASGTVLVGSCLDRLSDLADCSIDSIVTDPPYELGFMGKKWDATGIAYSVALWTECLRVLKPGGHLLAFGGTRTSHRMVCAIEDAGFEVRDSIHWTYGSGFPKSLDVSKAIDKAAGAEREVLSSKFRGDNAGKSGGIQGITVPRTDVVSAPATDLARKWAGWGTALKPSHEPVVVARKPLAGTVAGNVLAHGTGALNIDACRVGFSGEADERESKAKNQHADFGTSVTSDPNVYGDYSMVEVKNYNPPGRWPANTVLTHAAACVPAGTAADTFGGGAKASSGFVDGYDGDGFQGTTVASTVWACVAGCPAGELDQQSGQSASTVGKPRAGKAGEGWGMTRVGMEHADAGGASRFFTQANWDEDWDGPAALYVAKPSKRERNAGLDGLPEKTQPFGNQQQPVADGSVNDKFRTSPASNTHPTVKPVALMRHLVRLVTPAGGLVLDPFLGSGTTAVAAELEGMRWVGCELTPDYLPIIVGRVQHAELSRRA